LRDTLSLSILLLVESNVVIPADLDNRVEQLILLMLPPLFLLHDDGPLDIQVIVFIFQDLKKGWVLPAINTDLLEFVSEVLLDRQFLEGRALQDNVVLTLEDEAVDNEVFALEEI